MNDSILGQGGFALNRDDATLAQLDFPDDVYLVDSTIRSLQSSVSGSQHTAADLVDIGMAVDALGVRETIVNTSWRDGLETVAGLVERRPRAKVVATYRARLPHAADLLKASLEVRPDEICFESPVDVASLRRDTEVVKDAGVGTSIAFAERHSWDEMIALSRTATELGAASLSFHDSFFRFGVMPEAMKVFIGRIREQVEGHPALYIHLSNFYGTAAMTAVSGVTAGANAVDVCLNMTGHHCGHISLAEVALILEDLYGVRTGIELGQIHSAVDLVTERTGVPIRLQQPVIGEMAFMIDGADWAAEAHLPYDERMHSRLPVEPDVVGSTETMIWTDRTASLTSVKVKLSSLDLPSDDDAASRCHAALRAALTDRTTYPQFLRDAEFTGLLRAQFPVADATGSQ